MRKFICIFISCVLFALTLCTTVSAQEANIVNYQNYLGVICNADGEIVETIPMPRITYVDSVVELSANLESGYTFTTYQYKPTGGFNIGFKCIDDNGNVVTTRNCRVKMAIYNSASVGGTRTLVESQTFSTNEEDNDLYYDGWVEIYTDSISSSKPYYNGVFTNMSSKKLTIRIGVSCNGI